MRRILAAALLVVLCVVPIVSQLALVAHDNTTYEVVDVLQPVPAPDGSLLASVGDDYVDATYSTTYGTQTLGPPSGAGNVDDASSDWLEQQIGATTQDYVDQVSNLHSPSDIGTHSSFAEEQDKDGVYDTLTEANTGSATPLGAQGGEGTSYTTIGLNIAYGCQSTASVSGTVTNGYMYGRSSSGSINAKMFICNSAGSLLANGISNALAISTTAQLWAFTFATPPSITVSTAYQVWIISGGASIRLYRYDTTSGSSTYDGTNNYASPTSPTDFSTGTNLWRMLYVDIIPINYRLDLEVGWTAADFDEATEYLCVYGGTQNAESLNVDVWNGAAWVNVIADVQAAAWNNVSVSPYLTSAALEIRFVDTTLTGDTAAGTWQVEAVLLRTHTDSYALEFIWQFNTVDYNSWVLEALWFDFDATTTAETVDVYGGTTTSRRP